MARPRAVKPVTVPTKDPAPAPVDEDLGPLERFVRVVHPDAGTAAVAESSLWEWKQRGWRRADRHPIPEPPAPPAPPTPRPAPAVENTGPPEPPPGFVAVVHPDAGRAVVPESSLPHHQARGWATLTKE